MQGQPQIVDLFCGCGGFSLGAHRAGLSPKVAFDNDPILTSSYGTNFPTTQLELATVRRVGGSDIRRLLGGSPDGIIGGPPCQGFSDIGHRKSTDPRRHLVRHFFRIVSETRPGFFVMENVRGLGYGGARTLLEQSLELVPARYKILGPLILDAADYGAATLRARLFIIGYDPERCDPISEEDLSSRIRASSTVRAAIGDLSDATLVGEEDGFDVWKISRPGRASVYSLGLRSKDKTFTGHRVTIHTPEVKKRFHKLKPGEIDSVGRHPRLSWEGQCPNLRAGTGKDKGSYQAVRPIHPEEDRVITVREAARLQGFPDSFRFHPTVWHSFRMIGNSVSPIIAQAILSLIAERMGAAQQVQMAAE
ncbi:MULTISPECIES: DNA cytosine methyltransferase [unclassified Bradyrhizobium]|uniref:DNA cytosine methyltransferase n=1 Tax=unclassified Bradyrhizobium TaxID=2631580 RepID=UPI001FF9FCD4|nr:MULTISPECIES: DNA cytosine methyltransferase [unclassified Bradyrhizobium]MCK1319763.1 DNA cytosine methyltransferase [Bradyrhizobium sp. 156]MCK1566764.1 DNA cytosine methyltransferase [Bradyrhizobium sp. 173]UPJ27947.1 DNA cytosine methyltransferase [Bradyrhizobium sp. CW1]UPJ80945.1 DNA cytosine methyltransferase [Bradyrhizobium sp. 184]UPJ88739.1 DNA cytosine methyltransferase [Bradyrhizobium sp. 183]